MKNQNSIAPFLPVAALLIGGGILASKFLGSGNNETSPNELNKAIDTQKRTGEKPSFQDIDYRLKADQVYEGMKYSATSDNYALVESILKQMQNQTDVLMLIKAFGSRQEWWFGFIPDGDKKNLPTFVADDLSVSRIARINADYKSKGIKFRF